MGALVVELLQAMIKMKPLKKVNILRIIEIHKFKKQPG
jgi:hypothetical protein